MNSTVENIEKLIAGAGELAETKIELFKLKTAGKVSSSLSSVLAMIMVMVFASVAITVFSFGLAYWVGSLIDNVWAGFFIVAGFYALVGILLFVNRANWVERPLSNLFINKIIK